MFAKYKIIERNGNIAPFINEWNVWDIPKKQYTKAVEDAIIHAFELGANIQRAKMFEVSMKVEKE